MKLRREFIFALLGDFPIEKKEVSNEFLSEIR